jgi:hypothetical protein
LSGLIFNTSIKNPSDFCVFAKLVGHKNHLDFCCSCKCRFRSLVTNVQTV